MAGRRGLEPASFLAWQPVVLDWGSYAVAFFLFIYGGVTVRDPGILALMFGGGGALLGLPIARRADQRNGNGKAGGET